MTNADIIQILEAIVERDKADGCAGYAFRNRESWVQKNGITNKKDFCCG